MALFHCSFFSDALRVMAAVDVILPEPDQGIGVSGNADSGLPKVLYLLHGYSDDHTIWQRRTSVERYAAAHNLAIIMPAVNHSFYCNEPQGERYWDFVAEELPRVMHRYFRLSDRPEDTFVAGLSMGGFGAMKLALNFPERFGKACSFSGAVDAQGLFDRGHSRVFGSMEDLIGSCNDLAHLMKQPAKRRPKLYVSCGTKDFLYPAHVKFVPALKKAGWDVQSHDEPDATHCWELWDKEIEKVIPWLMDKVEQIGD